jgi:hypothetical protein
MPGCLGPATSKVAPQTPCAEGAPRSVTNLLPAVVWVRSIPGTENGESGPRRWGMTHLAFGDAQTVAMLDPAGVADKERGHFTGQKCLAPCTNPVRYRPLGAVRR